MKLREYLQQKRMHETTLASTVGVSQSHINNIVLGKKNPSIVLAKRIEKATEGEVTIYDLINPEAPSRLKDKEEVK